jgi:hypothetical protein
MKPRQLIALSLIAFLAGAWLGSETLREGAIFSSHSEAGKRAADTGRLPIKKDSPDGANLEGQLSSLLSALKEPGLLKRRAATYEALRDVGTRGFASAYHARRAIATEVSQDAHQCARGTLVRTRPKRRAAVGTLPPRE